MTYRFLQHTADMKVAIEAERLHDVLADGLALVRELVAGESEVRTPHEREIAVSAASPDELLLRFLRELLYWFHTDSFVPGALDIETLSPQRLCAVVRGEPFDRDRHDAQPEVKSVTRHQLVVERTDGGWRAAVVFDL